MKPVRQPVGAFARVRSGIDDHSGSSEAIDPTAGAAPVDGRATERQRSVRAARKQASRERILDAAGALLRREGPRGASIDAVMRSAGLTHGAFASHFCSKESLTCEALRHASNESQATWAEAVGTAPWPERARLLVRRYLTRSHRDDPARGCAIAALGMDVARESDALRNAFQASVSDAVATLAGDARAGGVGADPQHAIACLALCVGGLTLARAVADPDYSNAILRACREGVDRLTQEDGNIVGSATDPRRIQES